MPKARAKAGKKQKVRRRVQHKAAKLLQSQEQSHQAIPKAEFTFTCLLDGIINLVAELNLTEEQQSKCFSKFIVAITPPSTAISAEPQDVVMTNVEPAKQPLTAFHVFPNLPTELRLKIWQHALPPLHNGYRILTITGILPTIAALKHAERRPISLAQHRHSTILSLVCHESRFVYLEAYPERLTLCRNALLRFDPKTTIAYMGDHELSGNQLRRWFGSKNWERHAAWMKKVEILAVESLDELLYMITDHTSWGCKPILQFPNLKKFVLMVKKTKFTEKEYQNWLGADELGDNEGEKGLSEVEKVERCLIQKTRAMKEVMAASIEAGASQMPVPEVEVVDILQKINPLAV